MILLLTLIGLLVSPKASLPSLTNVVDVEFDGWGVPTVVAMDRLDAMRAQGYLHAQDRYFQMDLLRRYGAGELAALVGPLGVRFDQNVRRFNGRQLCEDVLKAMPSTERSILEAYATGVNALLDLPGDPAPEYVFIGGDITPWTAVDSLLVNFSTTMMLTGSSMREFDRWPLHEVMSAPWVDYLLSPVDARDRPMLKDDPAVSPSDMPVLLPVGSRGHRERPMHDLPSEVLGSNNWAVAGSRTAHGGAILANDPHLKITLPGLWYRIRLLWPDVDLMGLSTPGLPGIVIGTNAHVAWGFTNATIDLADYVIIEVDPADERRYRVPEGWATFDVVEARIEVAGGEPVMLRTDWTRWGPVHRRDRTGRPLALAWTVLRPEATNISLIGLDRARTVDEAIDVLRGWHGPPQNAVVADSSGRIGWVLTGWLPKRRGLDGRVPTSWADGTRGWDGPLDESMRPMLIDPPEGVLYTANNRTVDVARARLLGQEWASPDRVNRISELLGDRDDLTEADMLAMQLDTRVAGLDLYRTTLTESLKTADLSATQQAAMDRIEGWNGRADADQMGLVLLDQFRDELDDAVVAALTRPVTAAGYHISSWQIPAGPVRQVIKTKPPIWVLPMTWAPVIRSCFDKAVASVMVRDLGLDTTWGQANRSNFSHPAVDAAPEMLQVLLRIRRPQAGHRGALRVATPGVGASARLVVDPARPEAAILQTPAGQSGQFHSPHWEDLHSDWSAGTPTPLLPGPAEATLRLTPGG